MTTSPPDPSRVLPLTETVFEILLALAGHDRHGYEIMREVEKRTGGRLTLHAGTLYRALNRMLDAGLIDELDDRPAPDLDDQRRRYYRVSAFGTHVARAEAARLQSQVSAARARRFLKPSGPA